MSTVEHAHERAPVGVGHGNLRVIVLAGDCGFPSIASAPAAGYSSLQMAEIGWQSGECLKAGNRMMAWRLAGGGWVLDERAGGGRPDGVLTAFRQQNVS